MVTFAAVIMFVVAGFEVLSAILAFAGTGWWATASGDLVYANFVSGAYSTWSSRHSRSMRAQTSCEGGHSASRWASYSPASARSGGLRHPGGPDPIGRGHRALCDGDLRPCQIRRRGRLSALTAQGVDS